MPDPAVPRRLRVGAVPRLRAVPVRVAVAAGLTALVLVSLALRTTALHAPFWIDEGLSVGIASHRFLDIPGVLRLDGSPPLYYLVLHVWMAVFGDGQATTHVLSLGFALLTVPLAAWAAAPFGRRAAAITAVLAAVNPFLTYYAQETRMYALVALLALGVTATIVRAFVFGQRRLLPAFSAFVVALMYTHNWGLFLAVGTAVALVPVWLAAADRRAVLRDAAIAYGLVALVYLPWLPSLLFQAKHTGAPWSERPNVSDVLGPITGILGGPTVPLALLLAGGAGLATLAKAGRASDGTGAVAPPAGAAARRTAIWVLVALPAAGLVIAWTASQISPAFTGRYFAVFVGPLLLLAGIGLAHAGRLGLVALAIIIALWFDPRTDAINHKSDVRLVAARVKADLYPGDLVVSVHPEQVPVLHYYLPDGLRYADSISSVRDPQVFDWRDALQRLRDAKPKRVLASYVSSMRPGQTLLLVNPIIRTASWGAPWTKLVRKRSAQWQRQADRNPALVRIGVQPRFAHRALPRGVRATLYRKTAAPRDRSVAVVPGAAVPGSP